MEELAGRYSKTSMPDGIGLSADPRELPEYMQKVVGAAVTDSVNTSSPWMIGHMTSSLPFYMRPMSRLVTSLNQNVVKTETASSMTFLEREALAQLHRAIYGETLADSFYKEYVQDPSCVLGVFTSGGTLANLTALWAARNLSLGPSADGAFQGVETEGVFRALRYYGAEDAVVLGSELLHYSLAKGTDVLGLGTRALVTVPYDENFRVQTALLEAKVEELKASNVRVLAIIGIAGATETGSIDPLDELARIASLHNIHFHVDAAWGGPGVFSAKQRCLLAGIEKADSVTLDGHKQLYMPMGCGLLFFKHPSTSKALRKTAKYIIREDSYDLGKFTLEGSRPANAMYLHTNLNILGVRGYELLVDRSVRMVQYIAAEIIKNKRFELLVRPMTNILLYRAVPRSLQEKVREREILSEEDHRVIDKLNVALQDIQKTRGKTFVSRTTVRSPLPHHGGHRIVGLRVVVANPITFEGDIDMVLQDQHSLLDELEEDGSYFKKEGNLEIPRAKFSEPESRADHKPDEKAKPLKRTRTSREYWTAYWLRMPLEVRSLFKNDVNLFINSLMAPDNELDNQDHSLLRDERSPLCVQRHSSAPDLVG